MKYSKIIIAIDDGPLADKIALEGYELARQLEAEVALVSVADSTFNMSEGNITPSELLEIIRNDFKKNHRILIEHELHDDNVRSFVADGKPHEAIIRIATEWEADAIVIGTHGRTGLSRLVMGSVAESVLRHWTKATFVIPAKH